MGYAPKIRIFNSECSDRVLLFDIVISTPASRYRKYTVHMITNPWITTGITTSCQHKRKLYLISRDHRLSSVKIVKVKVQCTLVQALRL